MGWGVEERRKLLIVLDIINYDNSIYDLCLIKYKQRRNSWGMLNEL